MSDRFFAQDEPPVAVQEARLVAEICVRLVEWARLTGGAQSPKVSKWIQKLTDLHRADLAAMALYIAWQTGDTALISQSFDSIGDERHLPKQAVHQSRERAIGAMARVMPDLAKSMREIFAALAPEAGRDRQPGDLSLVGA